MSRQWKWGEDKYDLISSICTALTNFHIFNSPLSAIDGEALQNYRKVLYSKGVSKAEKRKISQQKYRENRRQRLLERLNGNSASDDGDMPNQLNFSDED